VRSSALGTEHHLEQRESSDSKHHTPNTSVPLRKRGHRDEGDRGAPQ